MNPLTIFATQYKLYILAAVFVIWSAGLWHIAATYTEAGTLKDSVAKLESNAKLSEEITTALDKQIEGYAEKARPITKEIQREIITNNIYSDCKSTPGVVRNYQDKLKHQ